MSSKRYLFLQEAINLVDNHHNRLNSVLITTQRSSSSGRIEGVQAAIHGFFARRTRIIISDEDGLMHVRMMHLRCIIQQ